MSQTETLAMEPNISGSLRSAISVPREFVIDPWSAPLAYLSQAVSNGGQAIFNAEVTGGEFSGNHWLLESKRGTIRAQYVINCAGLYGDYLDTAVLGKSTFKIKPRKGQFVVRSLWKIFAPTNLEGQVESDEKKMETPETPKNQYQSIFAPTNLEGQVESKKQKKETPETPKNQYQSIFAPSNLEGQVESQE